MTWHCLACLCAQSYPEYSSWSAPCGPAGRGMAGRRGLGRDGWRWTLLSLVARNGREGEQEGLYTASFSPPIVVSEEVVPTDIYRKINFQI